MYLHPHFMNLLEAVISQLTMVPSLSTKFAQINCKAEEDQHEISVPIDNYLYVYVVVVAAVEDHLGPLSPGFGNSVLCALRMAGRQAGRRVYAVKKYSYSICKDSDDRPIG